MRWRPAGDHSQGSGNENLTAKLAPSSNSGKVMLASGESPASPGKRTDHTQGKQCSPAKKLCSPSIA